MTNTASNRWRRRRGTIQYAGGELIFRVRVLDVKFSYGRTRYLVTPAAGSGQCYVDSGSVTLEPEQGKKGAQGEGT